MPRMLHELADEGNLNEVRRLLLETEFDKLLQNEVLVAACQKSHFKVVQCITEFGQFILII